MEVFLGGKMQKVRFIGLFMMIIISCLNITLFAAPDELTDLLKQIEDKTNIDYQTRIALSKKAMQIAASEEDWQVMIHINNLLANIYTRIGEKDKASGILDKSFNMIDAHNVQNMRAESHYYIAKNFMAYGQFIKAYEYILNSLEFYDDAGDYLGLAKGYIVIAQIFYNVGDDERCLEYAQKAENLAKLKNNDFYYILTLQYQGMVYARMKKYEQASDVYRRCIEMKDIDPIQYARTVMLISKLQISLGLYDPALAHAKRALELSDANQDISLKATINNDIGYLYKLKGDFDKALNYNQKALELRKLTKQSALVSSSLRNIGLLHLDHKNYLAAKEYLLEALEIGHKNGKHEVELAANLYLARLFEETNDYDSALKYTKIYATLKDSLNSYFIGARMVNLGRKYDLARKEDENEILRQQNKISDLELSRQRGLRRATFLAGSLLVVIILMLYFLYRMKRKHAESLEAKVERRTRDLTTEIEEREKVDKNLKALLHEKEVLLKEIHHRVKNNMQVISSMIGMQLKKIENPEFKGIFAQTQSRVRSLSLIHEKLYRSKNLADVDMKEYVETLVFSLFRSSEIDRDLIKLEMDIDEISMNINQAIPCGQIINELVTNIIKHAFPPGKKGEVYIALRAKQNEYYLEVADTGIGMSQNLDFTMYDTLGMVLVNALSNQLHAEVIFDLEIGTRIVLKFKEKKNSKLQVPSDR